MGDGNINDTLNAIGMITGNVNHATAYALINIESSVAQAATIKVGSDDAIKVWLNGVVVHTNAINRSTTDYQDAFGVNLNAGDNLLMVKVSEQEKKWRMFVGVDVPNPQTLGFHILQRPVVPIVPIVGNVTFSNPDLAHAVRKALSLPDDADIPKAQLATLTALSITGKGIKNLTGLEHATQLELLDLSGNIIDDLSPLTGLKNLKELDLSNNKIDDDDLLHLAGLTQLEELYLDNNNSISDMSPLAGLKNLTLHFNKPYRTINAYGSTVYNYDKGHKTVLIKGLELKKGWNSTTNPLTTDPLYLPDVSSPPFKVYKQPNDWTCGHTSALMLLNYYGVNFSTPEEGRNIFNDLAKGSWSIECYSELLTVYPNLLTSAALSSMAKKLLLACVPGVSDLVYQFGPGTLPHEMAIGLNKLFPFPTEVRNGTGDADSQKRFLEDQISRSCPPIILLKLKRRVLHWVVVVGYDTLTKKFLIADPSNSKKSWGKFKWMEWSHKPNCGPSLMDAWSLKYLGDKDCPLDVLWVPGAAASLLLLSGGTQYFAVVPTEAPPYHDPIKSQTFRIKTGGAIDPRKRAYEWDWVLEGDETDAGVVIDCKWSFARKKDSVVSVICNEGEKKVTVSGKPEAGLGQRIDVDMFLTVYYEGELDLTLISAPPAPSIVLSGTAINTSLLPNYPNPFNPETWIPYQLSEPADVTLTIYDIQGRVVRALDLGHQRAGMYHSRSRAAHWDGRNAVGEPVASGLYFYTLKAGDFTATRKMLIRK